MKPPLSRFDTCPQARLGTFESKKVEGMGLILKSLRENRRLNSLMKCVIQGQF